MAWATPCISSGAATSLGRDTEALECLQQALDSHQAAGNRNRQAATLKSLGIVQSAPGLVAGPANRWLRPPRSSMSSAIAPRRPRPALSGRYPAFPEIPLTARGATDTMLRVSPVFTPSGGWGLRNERNIMGNVAVAGNCRALRSSTSFTGWTRARPSPRTTRTTKDEDEEGEGAEPDKCRTDDLSGEAGAGERIPPPHPPAYGPGLEYTETWPRLAEPTARG